MLYMKTMITFRVPADLAKTLREVPNQTAFVEAALRSALGKTCPTCEGSGRARWTSVAVSDFKQKALPRLDRDGAVQLKSLVRIGRELAASKLDLTPRSKAPGVDFSLARGRRVLLRGTLDGCATTFSPN
jgi:hypothetical protein